MCEDVSVNELREVLRDAHRHLDECRAERTRMTRKLASILRLTYDEAMPDHLADVIRGKCAL